MKRCFTFTLSFALLFTMTGCVTHPAVVGGLALLAIAQLQSKPQSRPEPPPKIVEKPVYIKVPQPKTVADLDISSAISAFRDFRYQESLNSLRQLLDLVSPDSNGYVEALVYAGACAYMLKQDNTAVQYFQKAHQLNPNYHINTNEFMPPIVQLFYASR